MVFVLSRWRRSLTFPSGTRRTSSTSAKRRFCATFDRQPLTRSLQSAIMTLLVERPPEAPYFSQAEHLLYANQGAGNYQQGGRQSAELFFSPFKQECDEQGNTWPYGWVFSLCQKSHRWDTCRGSLAEVRVA